jgi:Di-haem oxidoreductase, putative peroxidase
MRRPTGIPLETPLNKEFEDPTGADGRADIDRFSDFMRALAPPPTLPQNESAHNGAKLFAKMGCAGCHTASLTTASNPSSFIPATTGGVPISQALDQTLANRTFHPYSDFLLHDMGSLGDGITSGAAGPTMMRTAPLWGVGGKSQFLHDGRAGGAFDCDSIARRAGQDGGASLRSAQRPSATGPCEFS